MFNKHMKKVLYFTVKNQKSFKKFVKKLRPTYKFCQGIFFVIGKVKTQKKEFIAFLKFLKKKY